MKRVNFFLVIIIFGHIACNDEKQNDSKEVAEAVTEVKTDKAKDAAEIRNTINDFYNWYNKNYEKLQKYDLYSTIKKNDMPPYKINWDQVAKYQDFIRSSTPQLGEEFISDQYRFFKQCDSAFKVDVEDDIPYGFDYDWYTNSQEDPQYLLDEMNKSGNWMTKVNGDDAIVDIKGTYDDNGMKTETTVLKLAMKKEKGTWKIARIGIE